MTLYLRRCDNVVATSHSDDIYKAKAVLYITADAGTTTLLEFQENDVSIYDVVTTLIDTVNVF